MDQPVTASMLYDLIACPHRVSMDLFAKQNEKDPPNPFVELLWERGSTYEKELIEKLDIPFLDLSTYSKEEKEGLTSEALERKEPLVYGGRISADNLLGDPDILRLEGSGYIAGDIKSGRGRDDGDNFAPKKHYGVQIALYTDILERKGLSAGRRAFIWDVHGEEVEYDFDEQHGVRNPWTVWDIYKSALCDAEKILGEAEETLPAYSGDCKLCHWYSACLKRLKKSNDLTLIPQLGRSKRDVMLGHIDTLQDLANADLETFQDGKKTIFKGIGPDSLVKLQARAKLVTAAPKARGYLREPILLPISDHEIFFDIEVDPMRDVCYLHGFVERANQDNDTEKFVSFFCDDSSPEAEREMFKKAWGYFQSHQNSIVYYYSKYERTIYRKLREKYPEVCSVDDIEALFNPRKSIDLYYDVVLKATEWPTRDHSIKTLATHLGFEWRDTHPSGAASIQWYDEWVRSGNHDIKKQILEYNEDDCRATRVLLDGIRNL
jgi:predicted RecB family nuclease